MLALLPVDLWTYMLASLLVSLHDYVVLRSVCRRLRTIVRVHLRPHAVAHLQLVQLVLPLGDCSDATMVTVARLDAGDMYAYAIETGSLARLEWLYRVQRAPLHPVQYIPLRWVAAWHGRLNALRWLHAHGVGTRGLWATNQKQFCSVSWWHHYVQHRDQSHCDDALLAVYRYHSQDAVHADHYTACCAAYRGHTRLLDWLCDLHGADDVLYPRLYAAAATGGHLSVLRALQRRRVALPLHDTDACFYAARDGHLRALRWLHRRGVRRSAPVFAAAVYYNHMDVLDYLYKRRLSTSTLHNSTACHYAAAAGRLDVLQWLHERGAPFDAETCADAASSGHLHVLRWLRARGCAWDDRVARRAARNDHAHVLEWLFAEAPADADLFLRNPQVCAAAASGGCFSILRALRARHAAWDHSVCIEAACVGHLAMLEWAIRNGADARYAVFECAARADQQHVLRWLHAHCRVVPGFATHELQTV